MELPPLRPEDPLGREVFSGSSARRINGGKADHNVFMPSPTQDAISVDRLGHASYEAMTAIGDRNTALRMRIFYGWAVVTVDRAQESGRAVRAEPVLGNCFHAEIDFNTSLGDDRRDAQKQHAVALARG